MEDIYFFGTGIKSLLPTADIIYSLDRIKPSFVGTSIEIRRVSDSASLVVGFDVNGLLDVSAIQTFSSNYTIDCRVVRSYNKSGGSSLFDLINTTASLQPYIVRGGSLVTDSNGNAALDFNGGAFNLLTANFRSVSDTIMDNDCFVVHVIEGKFNEQGAILEENVGNGLPRIVNFYDRRTPPTGYIHTGYRPVSNTLLLDLKQGITAPPINQTFMLSYAKNGTETKGYYDELEVANMTGVTDTYNKSDPALVFFLRLGAQLVSATPFSGKHIATFIFKGQKTTSEKTQIFNEIKTKYGII